MIVSIFRVIVTTRFSCKASCTITTKQHHCRFLVLKRNFRHERAGCALYTTVETGNFWWLKGKHTFRLGMWDNTNLQQHLQLIFCLFKNEHVLTNQKKRICLFFQGNIAQLKHCFAIKTLLVASAEWLKSLFVHAMYFRTHCIRTNPCPNKPKIAIVIATIGDECTTHRKCSQLFATHLQRNISSCRGGEFRESYCWPFL